VIGKMKNENGNELNSKPRLSRGFLISKIKYQKFKSKFKKINSYLEFL